MVRSAHYAIRPLLGTRYGEAVVTVSAGAAAALVGVSVATHGVLLPLACLLLALTPVCVYVARRYSVGPFMALLLFVACGLAPGIDGRTMIVQGIAIGDFMSAALVVLLLLENASRRFRGFDSPAIRWITIGSSILLLWWAYVLVHTVLDGTPLLQALRTGRDFGLFAIALPLAAASFTNERLRLSFIATSAALMVPAALAQAAAATVKPSLIGTVVHSGRENAAGEVARLDTDADDLFCLGVLIAAFALLTRPNPVPRSAATLLLAASSSYVLFTFTRARYLAVPLALATAAFLTRYRWTITCRASRALAVLGVVGLFIFATPIGARLTPVASTFTERPTSSFKTAPTASQDTVSVRKEVASRVAQKLDQEGAWFTGLGFRSDTSNYDPSFPNGSLRNSDIGVLNMVSTMGLVGAAILGGLCALAIGVCFRSVARVPEQRWLTLGCAAYGVFAFLSAPTLSALASSRGLLVTALALGMGLAAGASPRHMRGKVAIQSTDPAVHPSTSAAK